MCNGAAKQVSAGLAPCNIKCLNLFRNVEIGLKMNHGRLVPVSDWLTQRSKSGVTRGNSGFFTTATVASLLFVKLVSQRKFTERFHETDHVTRRNVC